MNTVDRRKFALVCGVGAGSLALRSLLADDGLAPHHPATARSVILLFMSGGPSQVDTFDQKPELAKLAGKDVPESIAQNVPKIKRAGLKNLMASPWKFKNHGDGGIPISDLFPETAKHADELCIIRSMTHRNPVHGPGECVALTGTGTGDRPSLGAWSIYGLGSESQQLPAFIGMNLHTDGMQHPQAAGWGPGFLPPHYQGTIVDPDKGIRDVEMPAGVTKDQRQSEIAAIQKLNRRFLESVGEHSELEARIRSFEVAFEMQTAAPELFDVETESSQTRRRYGWEKSASKTVGRSAWCAVRADSCRRMGCSRQHQGQPRADGGADGSTDRCLACRSETQRIAGFNACFLGRRVRSHTDHGGTWKWPRPFADSVLRLARRRRRAWRSDRRRNGFTWLHRYQSASQTTGSARHYLACAGHRLAAIGVQPSWTRGNSVGRHGRRAGLGGLFLA